MTEKILVCLPDDIYETMMNLKNQTLEDDDLIFFRNHTGSLQSWYRYIIQMGLLKTKEELEKFKRLESNNEMDNKS